MPEGCWGDFGDFTYALELSLKQVLYFCLIYLQLQTQLMLKLCGTLLSNLLRHKELIVITQYCNILLLHCPLINSKNELDVQPSYYIFI